MQMTRNKAAGREYALDWTGVYLGFEGLDAKEMSYYERRFVVTTEGRFGLVRADAKEGDAVCLFGGGQVMYLLRQKPHLQLGGEVNYQFIRECYIHGLIGGIIYHRAGEGACH